MKAGRESKPNAFTLVEMLVVIVIIGILVGLLLPAINAARTKALNFRIAVEVKNLAQAVEAYKAKNSDYPPDFSNRNVVMRHILKRWPQIDANEQARIADAFWYVHNPSVQPWYHFPKVDCAEALVFWLSGFSSDVRRPFTGLGGPFLTDNTGAIVGPNPERADGPYIFDKARLRWDDDNDPFAIYAPDGKRSPYVYFDARSYGGIVFSNGVPLTGIYPMLRNVSTIGWARPYLSAQVKSSSPYGLEWANSRTFQIVSAGLDDHYGGVGMMVPPATVLPYPVYPTGVNYTSPGDGDDDNITNFSEGSLLKDKKP